MERCSIDVPGSQRKVSMHGRVIGPILMLEMQGTCCARTGSWEINPKGSSLSSLAFSGSPLDLASLGNTCENFHDKVYIKV